MTTRIRLLLAAGLVVAGSFVTAAPAHACFNPDDPMCQLNLFFCRTTEPVAKYRDKVVTCYP